VASHSTGLTASSCESGSRLELLSTGCGQATQNAPTNKAIGPGPEQNDLANLPDDAFALVLTAIDEPRAAARMLSAYRRARAAVPVPGPSELGPLTPVLVQVQATSACLASSRTQDRYQGPGLMMAATPGPAHPRAHGAQPTQG